MSSRYALVWAAASVLLAVIGLPINSHAVETTIGAQYRPRVEARDLTLADKPFDVVASHRARLKFGLSNGDWGVQIDPQHTLNWGSEVNTTSGLSGNLDFHQAYAYGTITDSVKLMVGRQEIIFDDQRVLGNLDWTAAGRTFNALRFSTQYPDLDLKTDLFAALLREYSPRNEMLYGLRLALTKQIISGSLVTLAEHTKRKPTSEQNYWRLTPGLNLDFAHEGFSANLSGYGQFGGHTTATTTGAVDYQYRAALVAAKLGYASEGLGNLAVGGDYVSGDKQTADRKVKTFDTLYATNHKFYGHMDYFLALPKDTGRLGLIDAYLTWSKPIVPALLGGFAVHQFLAAQASTNDNRSFGQEIDAWVTHKLHDRVNLNGGYSLFLADAAMVDIARAADNDEVAHWLWAQLDLNF